MQLNKKKIVVLYHIHQIASVCYIIPIMHAPLLFSLESCWANFANHSQYLESKHCGAKNAKKKNS